MRGDEGKLGHMFVYVSPEEMVPANHPLRVIKDYADEILKSMTRTFDSMYAKTGRPSIPPERLLKSMILIALYTVRSDRMFCEQLRYNILFRWFLDMSLEEKPFDHSVFSKNRDRLMEREVARKFFEKVVESARAADLLSDEHFTVDGTLIEAWASMKSFRPKDEPAADHDDDPSNPSVDFHGEKRSNATHESKTDPDARLLRKGQGKEAKLCYGFHTLMEHRHGLIVDVESTRAGVKVERTAAITMLDRVRLKHEQAGLKQPATLAGDKGYHVNEFVYELLDRNVKPHIARISGRITPGLDGRTAGSAGYCMSQRIRKRVEEIFGWMKTVGGFRKTRFRGLERFGEQGLMTAAAYNLMRLSRLVA
jgi:transposase